MLLVAILWACSSADPVPVPAPAEADAEAERAELKAHMQGHLTAVHAVRDALVRCDVDAAKKANREFLDHKVAFDLPGDWLTHVGAMGEAAVALDNAADLPTAAQHAAEVAVACGACHGAVGALVKLPLPPEGTEQEAKRLQMVWNALIAAPASDAPGPKQATKRLLAAASCHTPSE